MAIRNMVNTPTQAVPKGLLHPVLSIALAGNFACAMFGLISSAGYDQAMRTYLSKGALEMGSGDLLMSFLGSVILSMGFRIYDQRETMQRHAPEILGATAASSLFSFFSSALLCKALVLQSGGWVAGWLAGWPTPTPTPGRHPS
ncbi:hypothetical protein FOA52_010316 [Chlamydomonas sp. UWO 241]|nr:hypothetical protein FOA52_010316 [Chlamydomonas sp. UWO 241]